MQFKIGQTVVRHDPGNHDVPFSIQSEQDIIYHTDLQERTKDGILLYPYTDITRGAEIDFDLPTVATAPMSKPRVHISEDVCISCT